MAITRIQQAQISGSLSLSDNVSNADLAKSSRTLADDLNSLRTQVKNIMGTSAWTDGLQGSQDLSDIYAAVHTSGANVAIQGTLSAGESSLSSAAIAGAATVGSTLGVTGAASFSSTLSAGASSLSSAAIAGAATVGSTLGVTGAATFSSSASISGGLSVTGDAALAADLGVMGDAAIMSNLDVAGDSYLNQRLLVSGSVIIDDTLSVTGASSLASAAIAGAATVGSTLGVTGAANFSSTLSAGASSLASAAIAGAATVGSTLGVTGAANFSSTLSAGASSLASAAIAGAATVGSTLGVTGAANFSSTLSAGASSLASAAIAGAATVGSTLGVTGAANFSSTLSAGASSLAALGVAGSSVLAGSLSVSGASSLNSLSVSGSVGLAVAGPADFNGGVTANSIKIDSDTAQRLYIVDSDGSMKDEANLMYDGSKLDIIGNIRVSGNAQIDGDLLVKGAFTYIETENMKVKDAFIYLATGSNGSVDSGIVLSKGAGAGFDLIVGQDGGAGEIVFAKVAHNVLGDSPADLNGAALVKSWMSGSYYGSVEGTQIGHAGISAGKMELKSAAGVDLMLVARGDESFKLADDGDMAQFEAQFGEGVSLVDAIVAAASGGNFKQDSFNPGAVGYGNDISFSAVGVLRAASIASNATKKVAMDVYLNGVRLSFGSDYSIPDVNNIRLVGVTTMVDDVISVVIHNAS